MTTPIFKLPLRFKPLPPKPLQPPPSLSPSPVPGIGAIVLGSRNTRPLWFDGRFLAAADLKSEQDYFLGRQAALARAAGGGVIHGLLVEQQGPGNETFVIRAGNGITRSGQLVMLTRDLTVQLADIPEEEKLNVQFGLSETPQQPARTRTGLYIVALRPVEFTANPITTYPTSLSASRVARDGDIVEGTAVALIPFPNPVNTFDASLAQAALAHAFFVEGDAPALSPSLLPLAVISVDRDAIQWIDPYLVRRDTGPDSNAVAQRAFVMHYDARLQSVTAGLNPNTSFAATTYFQALPAAGRFPFGSIDPVHLNQSFFPQEADITLAVIPADELPSAIEDALTLPPIDLTLPAPFYANLSLFVLVPVSRDDFSGIQASLPNTRLGPALPPAIANRRLLQLLRGPLRLPPITTTGGAGAAWANAIKGMTYGYYLRRRSEPVFPDFTLPPVAAATTTPAPTTTPGP
jgi:hypothetical protein